MRRYHKWMLSLLVLAVFGAMAAGWLMTITALRSRGHCPGAELQSGAGRSGPGWRPSLLPGRCCPRGWEHST